MITLTITAENAAEFRNQADIFAILTGSLSLTTALAGGPVDNFPTAAEVLHTSVQSEKILPAATDETVNEKLAQTAEQETAKKTTRVRNSPKKVTEEIAPVIWFLRC